MKNTNTYILSGLILLLLALFIAEFYPPKEKLRLGKDLAGGTSLVYAINLKPEDDAKAITQQIIDVLQNRINPTGTMDITFVPQSGGRLEITMPLPSPSVLEMRDKYLKALEDLVNSSITEYELKQVMEAKGEERQHLIQSFSQGSEDIARLFRKAAEAHDARIAAIEKAKSVPEDDPQYDALEEDAAKKWIAEDKAVARALSTSINRRTVEQVLEASDQPEEIINKEGKSVLEPSKREKGLKALEEQHPEQAKQIEKVAELHKQYKKNRKTLDDPSDLMRMLRGAGVLTMHIAASPEEVPDLEALRQELKERGPANINSPNFAWMKINKIENWYDSQQQKQMLFEDPAKYFAEVYRTQEGGMVAGEFGGNIYLLMWTTPDMSLTEANGNWNITGAGITADELGRPAVWFTLDTVGADRMQKMSKANLKRSLAVVLDNEVYTAPIIQDTLGAGRIRVTGEFSQEEIQYLVRVLSAGSLQARLASEPISINTLGPALGKDNLRRGLEAGLIAIIGVCVFMAIYYFFAGLVADFALACNAIIILGVMSMVQASFTLPGIAGIVLTFGMAVDANVLIYERIREELNDGADLRTAIRLGFDKAMSTIIDANITNLIVCFVLGYTATSEVKGFAVTLGVGIVATLFTCLIVTRVIFSLYTDTFKMRRFSMLAMKFPIIQRVLTPKINWLRLRPVFLFISSCYVGLGLVMIYHQGSEMLDTEFRGGTAITLQLASEKHTLPDGSVEKVPMTMTRNDVAEMIKEIGKEAAEDDNPENDELTKIAGSLDVLTMGRTDKTGVRADTFQIKTTVENSNLLSAAIIRKFGDRLEQKQPLQFYASDIKNVQQAPVFPVVANRLGDNLRGTSAEQFGQDVSQYQGGVVILLKDINPPVTVEDLKERIKRIRNQPDFANAAGRTWDVIGLEATDKNTYKSAAIVVHDENLSYHTMEPERWRAELAQNEWNLIREAMTKTTTLAGVQSFDSAIAQSFRATAIVSVALSFLGILIYIWLRFGSLRYSLAAIIALIHDVLAVIGLIAVAEVIYQQAPWFATPLHIEPFKIDLGLVAALLTIIGYSLNDTIVILDRVRENRGRLAYASADVINSSINQTISRTLITSGTTFIAVIVLYIIGGTGIRSFSYALLCGVVVGTYSSIAVAAPLVYSRKADRHADEYDKTGSKTEDKKEAAFIPAAS